jgi:quinol---cytochrome c reductase iron-sulfur subunit, bacillus type
LLHVDDLEPSREHERVPGPSLWPVGLALGIVVFGVGFATSWWTVSLGALLTAVFGWLWIRDLAAPDGLADEATVEPELRSEAVAAHAAPAEQEPEPYEPEATSYSREKFLEVTTLGLGAVIGGLIMVPVLGFTVLPSFLDQGRDDHDLGPLDRYPEGEWLIATFPGKPEAGDVSRLTVFVRNNGFLGEQPSFTILSNHCVHLGCPVQPNGPHPESEKTEYLDVALIPTQPSGFGCPCHGGQYDNEGNRTAGPPVRALDRYAFSVRQGNLFVGKPFSVSNVEGTGSKARIYKWDHAFPGVHVDGVESWLYPIQPPS